MFENLTDRLSRTLKNISGRGRLTEDNVKDTLREVRMALLEADVALPVVRAFVNSVKERAVGQEVSKSLSPGQAFIKIVQSELENAMELVGEFLQYNDNTVARGLFYQAVHAVLEVSLDEELALEHYINNFNRMFGKDTMDNVVGSVTGEVKFFGLTKTSMKLEGIEPHLRLIESYKKLHQARKASVSN